MAKISLDTLMGNSGPSYPEQIVAPYRKELADAGFEQLMTAADIDRVLGNNNNGIVLLVLNSVCGCSARVSRPGAILSLLNNQVPDVWATVFAGMEKEAVAHLREKYLTGLTPSSPNIAIFKNGKLQFILHRYQIESSSAETIAASLTEVYHQLCKRQLSAAEKLQLQTFINNQYSINDISVEH